MKRFFSVACLVCFALISAVSAFQTDAPAQNGILTDLLNLPAPPPVRPAESENGEKPARPQEFYKKENVPPDNAPIDDLIDFWKRQNFYDASHPDKITPSDKTLQRLIESVEDKPENLNDFLKLLPVNEDIAEKIKNIYDANAQNFDESGREAVAKWLKYKSRYYSDELLAEAQTAKDHKTYQTAGKEEELRALAKVDWKKAESLLERLAADKINPRTASFAKRLIYEHAIEEKDAATIEKYRDEFKAIVENKNASGAARYDAFNALSSNKEADEQDDWYLSLFRDQTLLQLNLGERTISHPLNNLVGTNPDKWIPIVAKLIGNNNSIIHNAAVQALAQFDNNDARRDALEPLLPWISNPEWAKVETDGRFRLIQSMDNLDMPESVPGLIWVLENDAEASTRSYAAESLGKYKDAAIAPAMLNALKKEPEEAHRRRIIYALIRNQSLSDDEQMSFLESYVSAISIPEGYKKVEERSEYEDENPLPVAVSIGKYLSMQTEPSEGLILRAVERQKVLEKENPEAAKILSNIMSRWQGRLIDLEMLARIERREADVETITSALAQRAELRERVPNELYLLRGKNGLAGALAACILEDENDILTAFHSQNKETSIGTLACARLLRKPLPIGEIGALLDSNDKLLALAAERYLESEDSLGARNLVLARHKGEALILGARDSFNPAKQSFSNDYNSPLYKLFATVSNNFSFSSDFNELEKSEKELRREIIENNNLTAIYAHLPDSEFGQSVVRIYKTHATFTRSDDKARFKEKKISKEELEKFLQALAENNVNEFVPKIVNCHHDCYKREFLSLNRGGGRRIFASSGFGAMGVLDRIDDFFTSGKFVAQYHFQKKIANVEILLADERFQPRAIWKDGNDFRVLISDEERKEQIEEELRQAYEIDGKNENLEDDEKLNNARKRKAQRAFEHYEWRTFKDGKLGEKADEPREVPFLRNKLSFPQAEDLSANENSLQAFYGSYEIRAGEFSKGGLWKVNSAEQTELKKGLYANPIVSGNWVVAAKAEENWSPPNNVVRTNLQTGKESKINLAPAEEFYPIAFVAAHDKVLLYRAKEAYSTLNPSAAEYYLLDAKTGAVEKVKGEFQPLMDQETRGLQPTGKPNEFWATVYSRRKNITDVGTYNAKDFTFKPLLTLPEILLGSTEIWIDDSEGKIYFIYAGEYDDESHLLALPLPR